MSDGAQSMFPGQYADLMDQLRRIAPVVGGLFSDMRAAAIIGTGLIGGSFGLALRKAGFQGPIVGVSSERSIEAAVLRGAVDRGVSLEEACAEADLIFLSQPISGILETLPKLNPLVRFGNAGDGRGEH